MRLRNYQKEDSAVITGWIQDEKSLYRWSADRLCCFPPPSDALDQLYRSMDESAGAVPLSAVEEDGRLVGHLLLRRPDAEDARVIRFGFVILDPAIRGRGNGKEMLRLAVDYAKHALDASRITLGVFADNDPARYCYEAVGFRPVGQTELYRLPIGTWECIEMALPVE